MVYMTTEEYVSGLGTQKWVAEIPEKCPDTAPSNSNSELYKVQTHADPVATK